MFRIKMIHRLFSRGCLLLLAPLLLTSLTPAAMASDGDGEGEKRLVITVVEEIPVEDIEDDSVPLAGFSDMAAADRGGQRHAALMGLTLLCTILYVTYFSRYEKRLFALRLEAAAAEERSMRRRREVHE